MYVGNFHCRVPNLIGHIFFFGKTVFLSNRCESFVVVRSFLSLVNEPCDLEFTCTGIRVFLEFATVVYDAGMISAAQISVEQKFECLGLDYKCVCVCV